MLDLKFIRENPHLVYEALDKRGEKADLEEIIRLDEQRRELLQRIEGLRHSQKEAGKYIGQLQQERRRREASGVVVDFELEEKIKNTIESIREIAQILPEWEQELGTIQQKLNDLLLRVPNIPHPTVPLGRDESDNIVVRTWGETPHLNFTPKPHWELGVALDIIDFERGVKLSGTRFYVLKGLGAALQRALITFMLDLHITKHGYTEVYPPFIVKPHCLVSTGSLPKFADNLYHDQEDDLWLIPTAEVPLTALHYNEILERETLPLYYVAYTPCFRREKMAAGRDTRGIKRGHQFDKVEMYKFVEPETSDEELEKLVDNAEDVCRALGLPYRISQLCTADLGFAAVKGYDVELWASGCQEWLEVSSCSNCGDFQARRANIRYRPRPEAKPQFLHTLNGSGLALPRLLIALLENYQQADGSILIPEVLRPYMRGLEAIG